MDSWVLQRRSCRNGRLSHLSHLCAHLSHLPPAVATALLKAQCYDPFPALLHCTNSKTETPHSHCARDGQDRQGSALILPLERPQAPGIAGRLYVPGPLQWPAHSRPAQMVG